MDPNSSIQSFFKMPASSSSAEDPASPKHSPGKRSTLATITSAASAIMKGSRNLLNIMGMMPADTSMACLPPQPHTLPHTLPHTPHDKLHYAAESADPQCGESQDRTSGLFYPMVSWMNPLQAVERALHHHHHSAVHYRHCYAHPLLNCNLNYLYVNHSLTKDSEFWDRNDLPDEFVSEQQREYLYYQQMHEMKQMQMQQDLLEVDTASHELFLFEGAENPVECRPCDIPRLEKFPIHYGPEIKNLSVMSQSMALDVSKSKLNPEAREWHSSAAVEGVKCSRLNPEAKEWFPECEKRGSSGGDSRAAEEGSSCELNSNEAGSNTVEDTFLDGLSIDISNRVKEDSNESIEVASNSEPQPTVGSSINSSECDTSSENGSSSLVEETLYVTCGSPAEVCFANLLEAKLDKFPDMSELNQNRSTMKSPSNSSVGCVVYAGSVCESDDDIQFCDDSDDDILFCDSEDEAPSSSGCHMVVAVICGDDQEDDDETNEADSDDESEEESSSEEESDLSDWSDDDSVEFAWDDDYSDETECCVLFDPRPSIAEQAEMVSLAERERQNSLSESDKANMRWEDFYGCIFGSSPTRNKKSLVSFSEDVCICPVDKDVDRKGEWEMYARDAQRFRDRINSVGEKVISPVLLLGHRKRVFADRFCDEKMLEDDRDVLDKVGGWDAAVVLECSDIPTIVVECVEVPAVSVECVAVPLLKGCG